MGPPAEAVTFEDGAHPRVAATAGPDQIFGSTVLLAYPPTWPISTLRRLPQKQQILGPRGRVAIRDVP
jgi:hypothetical protein